MKTLDRLVENAKRMRKESQHVASAALLLGLSARSLCVWCADDAEHRDARAWRLPRGGECERCAYSGYDCLVVEGGAA